MSHMPKLIKKTCSQQLGLPFGVKFGSELAKKQKFSL